MSIKDSGNYPGIVRSGKGRHSYKINQWNVLRPSTRLDFKGLDTSKCRNNDGDLTDLNLRVDKESGDRTFPTLSKTSVIPVGRKSSLRSNELSATITRSTKGGGRVNELSAVSLQTRAFLTGRQEFAENTPEGQSVRRPCKLGCKSPTPSEKSELRRRKTPVLQDCLVPRTGWFPLIAEYKQRDDDIREKTKENDEMTTGDPDMLPIKGYKKRFYQYRYSSARPTLCNKTQKEEAINRCWMIADVEARTDLVRKGLRETINKREDPRNSCIDPRYMNTSLEESMKVLTSEQGQYDHEKISKKLYVPYKATSEFGSYVTDVLHPNWKSDPRLKRKIFYKMRRNHY